MDTGTTGSNSGHCWQKSALQHRGTLPQHQWKKEGESRQKRQESYSLSFPSGDRIRPRRKGNLQVLPQTDCRGEILSRLHCHSVLTIIPGSGWRHFLAAGSCHSQCLRELPGLGTKELRASRTRNQGISVDATFPNKIKPEALTVALPPLTYTVVPQSQWACQEWEQEKVVNTAKTSALWNANVQNFSCDLHPVLS